MVGIFSRVLVKAERKYCLWQSEDVQKARAEFKEEKIGLNECCKRHGMYKRSFKKYLKGSLQQGNKIFKTKKRNIFTNVCFTTDDFTDTISTKFIFNFFINTYRILFEVNFQLMLKELLFPLGQMSCTS
jgi:hypothetical protein